LGWLVSGPLAKAGGFLFSKYIKIYYYTFVQKYFMDIKGDHTYIKGNLEKETPNSYTNAINFITIKANDLNSISCNINQLTNPIYNTHLRSNIGIVQENLYSLNQFTTLLPEININKTQSPYIISSRDATISLSSLATKSTLNGLATTIANEYQPWLTANIINSTKNYNNSLAHICLNDYGKGLSNIIGNQSLSALTLQTGILKGSQLSIYAEKSLFSITSENFGSKIALLGDTKIKLNQAIYSFSESYAKLAKSYESSPFTYTKINPSITRLVPSEYFSTANLVEVISTDEDILIEEEGLKDEIQYENEVELSKHLPKLNNGLLVMWQGAIQTYHSSNPDRIRQFSVSIRELYTHLLQILAPDNEVKNWTTNEELYHNGRPTRKARLLYVCRNINNHSLEEFVNKDVAATLSFIDVFQDCTHSITPNYSSSQLLAIRCKAESTIKFLLAIHFSNNE
jgi:hypothetical protein